MNNQKNGTDKMDKKAIVVDHDFFFVEFMSELLESWGYEVIKAYDGKEGMQALETNEPDLVFLDMVLPKVDGWTLIRYTLKKFPERRFPIFVVSGIVIEQLEELDRIGADYYIAKGPLTLMKELFSDILIQVSTQPLPGEKDQRVFGLASVYPRRESVALIKSLHFQHAITESIGMGVLIVDEDTRILSTNGLALKLLNKTEVDVWNRPIPALFIDRERTRLINGMKEIAQHPELGKVAVTLFVNGRPIRSIVSLFSQETENKGWIITMENMADEESVLAN